MHLISRLLSVGLSSGLIRLGNAIKATVVTHRLCGMTPTIANSLIGITTVLLMFRNVCVSNSLPSALESV